MTQRHAKPKATIRRSGYRHSLRWHRKPEPESKAATFQDRQNPGRNAPRGTNGFASGRPPKGAEAQKESRNYHSGTCIEQRREPPPVGLHVRLGPPADVKYVTRAPGLVSAPVSKVESTVFHLLPALCGGTGLRKETVVLPWGATTSTAKSLSSTQKTAPARPKSQGCLDKARIEHDCLMSRPSQFHDSRSRLS